MSMEQKHQFTSIGSKNDDILSKIIAFPSETGQLLLRKFSIEYLIGYLDRAKIESIDRIYQSKEEGFNILQFVRFFLNVVEHKEVETLYLTISLIDFFREISQANGFCQRVKFTYITNFICTKILQKRNSENQIEAKHIPQQKCINPSLQLKDYLLNPPIVYGSNQQAILKLSSNNILIDKNKHESVVSNCYFSQSLNRIFSLDALSDSISVYDTNCNLIKRIRPTSSRLKKNIILLSFAYSERQERVGAVLKDFSLIFWDSVDQFEFEKNISTATHCHQCQTAIYFLEHFNKWITSDRIGNIYIWDIEKEKPDRSILCKFRTKINDLCEIPCLNLLAVVQENRSHYKIEIQPSKNVQFSKHHGYHGALNRQKIQQTSKKQNQSQSKSLIYLYSFTKGQAIAKIDLGSQGRIPHTIQYSETYQVLIAVGYQKKISILQVHPRYLDTNIKGQLLGHQSLVTCFTILKGTPMIVSADDKGKVKVWDIRNYKCLQTLDFRDRTVITRLLSLVEIGKIAVLGSRINLIDFDEKNQLKKRSLKKDLAFPIAISCDYKNMELVVLTKKDLRVLDFNKGLVKHILCEFFTPQEQITCFKYLQVLKKFIVGNERGQLKIYCIRTGSLQSRLSPHKESITFLQYDQHNKLFITGSADSSILIQRQSSGIIRQIRNNFFQKDISLMSVSVYHGLIAIGCSSDNAVYLWDYEYAKLLVQVRLDINVEPTALEFINYYGILVLGGTDGIIRFLKIGRKEDSVCAQWIWQWTLNDPQFYPQDSQSITKDNQKSPSTIIATHLLVDIVMKGTGNDAKLADAKIYVGMSSGQIARLNVSDLLKQMRHEPSISTRQSYNPERQLKENFISQIHKKKYLTIQRLNFLQSNQHTFHKVKIVRFQAHTSSITALETLSVGQHYLLTVGSDQRIKIWRNEKQICDFNINVIYNDIKLPLPYQWELSIIEDNKIKDKIMISLKVIQNIFKKFGSDISIGESKVLKVQKLFQEIEGQGQRLTEPTLLDKRKVDQQYKVRLFQDEFTLQDLHYDLVKKHNFKQIAGPTLRQIQMKKKLDLMHKEWHHNKIQQQSQKQKLLQSIQNRAHKYDQKDQVTNFLKEKHYRSSLQINRKQPYSKLFSTLNEKLNNYTITGANGEGRQGSRGTVRNNREKVATLMGAVQSVERNTVKTRTNNNKWGFKTFEDYYREKDHDNDNHNQIELQKQKRSTKKSNQSQKINPLNEHRLNRISQTLKDHRTSKSSLDNQRFTHKFPTFRAILNDMDKKVRMSRRSKLRASDSKKVMEHESLPCTTPSLDHSKMFTSEGFYLTSMTGQVQERVS